MWQAIRPHLREPKQFLVWQVTPLQAAGALSASQGGVLWPTKGRLRDKLWDDWGTNRTVTVWQNMQVLSDKLTSRCVTSYLSSLVTSKTDSYATNRSFSSCRCVVSKPRSRYMTNQQQTAWQAMGWLRHKQWLFCLCLSHPIACHAVALWLVTERLLDLLTAHLQLVRESLVIQETVLVLANADG